MAKKKEKPAVVTGSHLTVTTWPDGRVNLEWDWDALTREIQIATGIRKVQYVDVGDLPSDGGALVKTTEAKVRKTRAKKIVAAK